MTQLTRHEMRNLIKAGAAVDITRGDEGTRKEVLRREGEYKQIAYTPSVRGCGGRLLQGVRTGRLYAIAGRTRALNIF